jgi:tetratricopeptide (TPR) repeat protein
MIVPTFEDALTFYKTGRTAEAEALCATLLRQNPEDVNALHLLGVIALHQAEYSRAVEMLNAALRIYPELPQAFNNLAAALIGLKDFAAAEHSACRALALKPDFALAHNNRGIALRGQKKSMDALEAYNTAIAIKSDYVEAFNNRGTVLCDLGRYAEAGNDFSRALSLRPDYVEAHHNQGLVHKQLHQHSAALACFARASALNPAYAEPHWETALTYLQCGNFADGWKGYEWRWQTRILDANVRTFAQPLWRGETSLAGKTILVHAEQGLGDTIQFCRYAALLDKAGARVVLEVQAPLLDLLQDLAGVSALIAQGDPLPSFDVHCPLMSLPLAFGTRLETIPSSPSYLEAAPDKVTKWSHTLGERTRPRIGLVWSGNPQHRDDHNRSIPLQDLLTALPEGCDLISLQTDVRASDRPVLEKTPRVITPNIADFTDTAALCTLMDVVVSVDTSVVHLAGALGRPVFILLPFLPDWRWLLGRTDSPWYPTARLYRQGAPHDWREAFAGVKRDLLDRLQ